MLSPGSEPNATEHVPRPPLRQARRLSISFRKIQQVVATITHADIFIGSLTGTSERFASSLAEKAAQRGAIVSLKSLEEFDPECYQDPSGPYHSTSRLTVFVVSTHFAGGPSPNAEAFSQWLRLASGHYTTSTIDPVLPEEVRPSDATTPIETGSPGITSVENSKESSNISPRRLTQIAMSRPVQRPRRQSSFSAAIRPLLRLNWRNTLNGGNASASVKKLKRPLDGVQYAVFGVGNSMYLTYNAMGKFVDARMQALGAVRLCPLGLGDVSNDIDDAFAKWEAHLLQLLMYQKPGPPADIAAQAQQALLIQQRMTSVGEDISRKIAEQKKNATGSPPEPAVQRLSSSEKQNVELLRQSSGITGTSSTNTSITSKGSPVKLSMQDHYGRHVRLKFRCRYVSKLGDKPPTVVKLPPLVTNDSDSRPQRKLSGRHTSVRRDATHIRHPCIAVQSITMLKRVTASGDCQLVDSAFKDVSLARLVIMDPELKFETADTFGYFPPNSTDVVDAIGNKLGLDMDAYVELSFHDDVSADTDDEPALTLVNNKDCHLPFPSPCRIRTILSEFLELRTISREFVRIASGFATNKKEHELLENLASIDGSTAFNREFGQSNSGILKMLELAPSLRIPFEVFVNMTPLLKPRLYSIASSHVKNDRAFDIVVALGNLTATHGLSVSNFRKILSNSESSALPDGSNYYSSGAQLQVDACSVPVIRMLRGFVATSRFNIPPDLSAPMVMIANGIGVAPLRALMQHREFEAGISKQTQQQLAEASNSVPISSHATQSCGKALLLLGCSNTDSTLFESELRNWEAIGLLEFHVAHSSQPGQPPAYVQDLVANQKQKIASLMSSSPHARIYICGKIAMARAVNQILASPDSTTNWYQKALQSGRYIEGIYG
ncbi:unnamed protein product [Phytophthora lilii]|uniref:NADPH--hemoprotein reductase n=1 Tax=Phytophthora lilii TaxID=2077276 RepID=A0A9W6WI11_9STRA|nr:unnamed protein product [Phytophthora lilii]